MSTQNVYLIDRSSGAPVEATLYEGLTAKDLLLVERQWKDKRQQILRTLLAAAVPRDRGPESLHWDWSTKAQSLGLLGTVGWGVECNGEWQEVALTDSASHFSELDPDKGKPLVYIDYIESAPWNWTNVPGQRGLYAAVGSILFRTAMRHSDEQGFHGRIGLHALRKAESFYEETCGMTRLRVDHPKEGLVYFELSRKEAQRQLALEE